MATEAFRRAGVVVSEVAGDRAVLLNSVGLEMITLNPVGTVVWGHLDSPRRIHEIVDHLQGAYPEVDNDTLSGDVNRFLDELLDAGLIVRDAAS